MIYIWVAFEESHTVFCYAVKGSRPLDMRCVNGYAELCNQSHWWRQIYGEQHLPIHRQLKKATGRSFIKTPWVCVCVCISTTVLTGTSSHTVASLSLLTPVGKNVYFLGPHSNPNVVTLQILPGNLFIQRSRWRCMCLLHIHFNQFTLRKSVSMGLHSYVSYTNKIMEMGDLSVYCTMCGVSTVTGDLLTMVHSTDWYL